MHPRVGLVVSIGAPLDLNNLKEKGEKGEKAANRITGTSRLEFSLAYSEKPGESRRQCRQIEGSFSGVVCGSRQREMRMTTPS